MPTRALGLALLLALPGPTRAGELPWAALRQAVAAYRQGDFEACASRAASAADPCLNKDVAVFLEAQCLFHAGHLEAALARFEAVPAARPDTRLAALAASRRADCLWELGRGLEAAQAYMQAAALPPDPRVDGAVGFARRAELALSLGREEEARALWLALRRRHPEHPLASPAPPGLEERPLSPQASLALARALHAARRWAEALRVLDASPDPGEPQGRWELAFLQGRSLFDMRGRYAEAHRLLAAARERAPGPAQREEAWFWASRALSRADLDDAAIRSHLDMAARFPGGRFADQALFFAGWLEQNEGRCARALPILARVEREHPRSRFAEDARWFQAWCHLGAGDWAAARQALAPQRGRPEWQVGGRALYWSGVAAAAAGEPGAARESFAKVLARHPLTWYALLAGAWLGPAAPAPPPAPADRGPAPARTDDELLRRAEELSACDLGALASDLLRAGEKELLARHPGRAGLLTLLDAYARAGDAHRPWRLSVAREGAALRALPTPATRRVWAHAYPAFARELLVRGAGGDPELARVLQAIMRSESGFDPLARSSADARGLLQMLPSTAARAAEALGLEDHEPARLFEPETNAAVAAWHIGALAVKFKRQWPLVAAAYNGGVPAVERWLGAHRGEGLDWFVEGIPYAETRAYVKGVMTSLARYAHLEGAPLPAVHLPLDPVPLPGPPEE